jgi:hypothetical protein
MKAPVAVVVGIRRGGGEGKAREQRVFSPSPGSWLSPLSLCQMWEWERTTNGGTMWQQVARMESSGTISTMKRAAVSVHWES